MAGASSSAISIDPKVPANANQPATAPGIDTLAGWSFGIESIPASRRSEADTPDPAQPEALRAAGSVAPGAQTRAKRSPPIPHVSGATVPWTALAAIAASTAFPPPSSTPAATADVRLWGLATAKRNPDTCPRPVVIMSSVVARGRDD